MSADKKTLIYEAALSLVYETNDISSIKVADIAERAKIGKGTVYEYFKSKEQVLAEAITYMLKQGMESFDQLLKKNKGFKETYMHFLSNFSLLMEENQHLYNFLTVNVDNLALHTSIHSILQNQFSEFRRYYFQMVEKLADKSVAEGIVKPNHNKFQRQTAVLNSITCIFLHKQFPDDFELTDEEVLEQAYTSYVKLLN